MSARTMKGGRPAGAGAAAAAAGTGTAAAAGASVWGLGVSKIGKISEILQIFGGLVLGSIKTKYCKKICV